MAYDPKKAALFNQLRQQGVSEEAAIAQAGITDAEIEDYAIGMNGQLGSFISNSPLAYTDAQKEQNARNFQYAGYDQSPDGKPAQQPAAKTTTYTSTSTVEVSGGGSTTIISGEDKPTAASRALQPAIDAKQAEIEQFNKDNPSNFARRKLGLPPLTPEENQARNQKALELSQQKVELANQQESAMIPGTPTITTVPNTTTTTTTVTSGTTSVNNAIQSPGGPDPNIDQQTETNLGASIGAANVKQVATPVAPLTAEEQALVAAGDAGAGPGETSYSPAPVAQLTAEEQALVAAGDAGAGPGETSYSPAPVDDTVYYENNGTTSVSTGQLPSETEVSNKNATVAKLNANQQATLQSRYKQPGNTDWRVRLQLAPNSDYLYTASDAGILAPLAASNGLIFPYTPQITTSYAANYEQYDLVHSNYRGLFYKNSKVGDVQIRATFTAQDSVEANYLLAVIHFFRSVTKMFYGQDAQRGTPPPLVYLSGFGNFQFSQHPCVVSQFNYTMPNEVDYIRATNPNNYGTNLLNRRTPTKSAPGGVNFAGALRLANALLPKGGKAAPAAQQSTPASVNNTDLATYVPTKMEIDITLIPVQSRSQVSKQFSLKEFANGNLIKKGFW